MAYNTVVRGIGQLEAAGIVKLIKAAKRHRVWCAKSLLDILEEPARLEVWEPERIEVWEPERIEVWEPDRIDGAEETK